MKRWPWLIRLTHWEYWPAWAFYWPVWLQHFWLALKVKNLYFFLATNPGIEGFILSDSKYKTMELVPPRFRPKSMLVRPGMESQEVLLAMDQCGISFPVVLKPNVGYRGINVQKVDGPELLRNCLAGMRQPYLLQEFCSFPLEFGIFYYRFPGEEKGCIPSITAKEFLKVVGTGRHSLRELVQANPRALLQEKRLRQKYIWEWDTVIPEKKEFPLEGIGNHNLGTRFMDVTHLADVDLLACFDTLNNEMQGFHFGRFDLRTPSWEALKAGNFTILEVNGVGGEPTHIYDPNNSLWKAWCDLCASWSIAACIARENIKRGTSRPGYPRARQLWESYKNYRAVLHT